MKKLALVPLAVLALAACGDMPTSTPALETAGPLLSQNEVNGPTLVTGTYSRPSNREYTFTGDNPNIQCRNADGQGNGPYAWNVKGKPNRAPGQDKFCESTGGATVTCTFTARATYSADAHVPGSGERLNFDANQAVGYHAVSNPEPDLFVHYQPKHQTSKGEGALAFTATCGGTTEGGTLDLNQFDGSDSRFGSDGTSGSLSTDGVQVAVGNRSCE